MYRRKRTDLQGSQGTARARVGLDMQLVHRPSIAHGRSWPDSGRLCALTLGSHPASAAQPDASRGEDATNELSCHLFTQSAQIPDDLPPTSPVTSIRARPFHCGSLTTVQDGSRVPEALINMRKWCPNFIKGLPDQQGAGPMPFQAVPKPACPTATHLSACTSTTTALEMLMNNSRLHYYMATSSSALRLSDPTASRRGRIL